MKPNKQEITDIVNDKYTKISEVRKLIKLLIQISYTENDIPFLLEILRSKEKELRKIYRSKEINFIPIKNGFLSIGGRPGSGKIEMLKNTGITTVVTLLKKTEKNVDKLGELILKQEMTWIHFPLSASELPLDDEFTKNINSLYDNIINLLSKQEKIFIHCAAGIHRTGSFTNGLLQKCGFSKNEAKELIYKMRPVTGIEAVPKHWKWSEKVIGI